MRKWTPIVTMGLALALLTAPLARAEHHEGAAGEQKAQEKGEHAHEGMKKEAGAKGEAKKAGAAEQGSSAEQGDGHGMHGGDHEEMEGSH